MAEAANAFERMALVLGGGPQLKRGDAMTPDQEAQVKRGVFNMAQSILAASNTSVGSSHDNFMYQLMQGAGGLGKGVKDARLAQQQNKANQLKLELEKANVEVAKRRAEAMKTAPRYTGGDMQSFYQKLGMHYMNNGLTDEAAKYLPKPIDQQEVIKLQLGQRKFEDKYYQPVQKALGALGQLKSVLKNESGAGSYAAMIKFIGALDDSVVREGEVRAFTGFQGLITALEVETEKLKGRGFPAEVKANLYNTALASTLSMVQTYQNHVNRSSGIYSQQGLDPDMIFPQLQYDEAMFKSVDADFFNAKNGGSNNADAATRLFGGTR